MIERRKEEEDDEEEDYKKLSQSEYKSFQEYEFENNFLEHPNTSIKNISTMTGISVKRANRLAMRLKKHSTLCCFKRGR